MIQHFKHYTWLAAAALLACAPALARDTPPDAGTTDAGTTTAQDTEAGSCTGKATFCGVYGQTFCSSQPGCMWSFAMRTCNGLPVKCETATNAAFCKKIKGCKWQ